MRIIGPQNQLAQALTFLICFREVPGYNFSRYTIVIELSRGFPQPLQAYAGVLPKII
jgi:hypothetical protein